VIVGEGVLGIYQAGTRIYRRMFGSRGNLASELAQLMARSGYLPDFFVVVVFVVGRALVAEG
jgi:hypothetical protein